MKRVLAFGASNSIASINKKLAVYTAEQLNQVKLDVVDLNDYNLPVFGVDLEAKQGIPSLAHDFLSKIEQSDGIIISFAEHNGAYSSAFKNIFDWVSRIRGDLWSNKPMFALATSPGQRGGASVLKIAMDRFQFMGGHIVASFSLPSFGQNFSDDLGITNDALKTVHTAQLEAFVTALHAS